MKKKKARILLLVGVLFLLSVSGCAEAPKDERLAKDYLGMTFGEIKEQWGEDCILGGDILEGLSKGVCYEDQRTPYIFLFEEELTDLSALPDDAVVTTVRAKGGEGKPCELLIGEEPQNVLLRFYNIASQGTLNDPQCKVFGVHIQDELVSVEHYYSYLHLDPRSASPDFYEVYVTPEIYRDGWHWHNSPAAFSTDPETGETLYYDLEVGEWLTKAQYEKKYGYPLE